ncbi:MAG: endo alpha-1,4 polygalactosaminidase [Chloroflexi bacterium]|nr:endo alpha-1,4 polygalactosaminidase [Chloroflexota bacterium]
MSRVVVVGFMATTVAAILLVVGWACSGADESNGEPQQEAGPLAGNAQDSRLSEVRHWLYMIDVDLDQPAVDLIAASEHDLVVLDFIPSERGNADYLMAEVVAQLQDAPNSKLVLAYINIGEAEDYRTYWQDGWEAGDPGWILGDDPDGWEGNFPVAFWNPEWREIWLAESGYIEAIVAAGFDGVYLDWVEAYSDELVLSKASEAGLDARREMVSWVTDLADLARGLRPGFIVIAQNAAELADDDDYLRAIDAIAQEQVWFDGGVSNDPPGDCPLPATDDAVESDGYVQSLSDQCRRQHDEFPESTLHVSSEEYIAALTYAQQRGELIFTVDYALDPVNVAWTHETSRALGFVSFVGSRALDVYVEPLPY